MNARRGATGAMAAYLLHRHDWSETSLIVELFTREQGRVAVAAKGAKRPTSQLRAVLLPFQRIQVQLGRTPPDDGDLHLLRHAEWAGGMPGPGGEALFAGFYLNELLLRLLARHDPHPRLFDAYAEILPALGGDAASRDAALRAFDLRLLRELGLLPELSRVTLTQQAVDDARCYRLDAEAGVLDAPVGRGGLSGVQLRAAESALADDGLASLRAVLRPAAADWRAPLRGLVHYHLGAGTLRTRDVVHGLRRLLDPPVAAASRTAEPPR
ncbi:MAG: DNA repair protein RecO [Rubrivivax sp.]|jgi:DNA repair protein RecO (recombination protein O)|nr:DNA repair protein RecO [Rubrivivax sp.]